MAGGSSPTTLTKGVQGSEKKTRGRFFLKANFTGLTNLHNQAPSNSSKLGHLRLICKIFLMILKNSVESEIELKSCRNPCMMSIDMTSAGIWGNVQFFGTFCSLVQIADGH